MGLPGFGARIYNVESGYLIPTRNCRGKINGKSAHTLNNAQKLPAKVVTISISSDGQGKISRSSRVKSETVLVLVIDPDHITVPRAQNCDKALNLLRIRFLNRNPAAPASTDVSGLNGTPTAAIAPNRSRRYHFLLARTTCSAGPMSDWQAEMRRIISTDPNGWITPINGAENLSNRD